MKHAGFQPARSRVRPAVSVRILLAVYQFTTLDSGWRSTRVAGVMIEKFARVRGKVLSEFPRSESTLENL